MTLVHSAETVVRSVRDAHMVAVLKDQVPIEVEHTSGEEAIDVGDRLSHICLFRRYRCSVKKKERPAYIEVSRCFLLPFMLR